MNTKLRFLTTGTAAIVAIAWLSTTAHAQGLDHFLCYKGKGKRDVSVTLSDSLDSGSYTGKGLKLFCNPADKENEGIADADTHLDVYKIKGPHVAQTGLVFSNQFGTYTYDTKKTDTLMVPASKSIAPDPAPSGPPLATLVDHYRCLKAKTSKGTPKFPKGTVVSVVDQFGVRSVAVTKPSKVCIATDKNGEGVNRPTSHLVCYKIKPTPKTSQAGVQTADQFGGLTFDVKSEAELCVPSVDPSTVCPATFGLSPVAAAGVTTSQTSVESGWTGLAHWDDVPEGYALTVDATCASASPPCGACTLDGLAGGGKKGRCVDDSTTACDVFEGPDLDDCAGGLCSVFLLPPVHTAVGNNAYCVTESLSSDVGGAIDNELGDVDLDLDVRLRWYIDGTIGKPCPICVGDTTANDGSRDGVCAGGARNGLACDANGGNATFGATSLDCLPQSVANITGTGLPKHLELTTGAVSLPAANACDFPFGGLDCFCGVCSGNTSLPCEDSADCAAAGAGTCTSFGAGVSRLPNDCDDFTCSPIGGDQGVCNGGPSEMFCDGFLRSNGEPIIYCFNDGDCALYDSECPGGDCGSCTITRPRPCFLDPIVATGSTSATAPLVVGKTCMAPTINSFVNYSLGLPGPERTRLQLELSRGY